MAHAGSAQARSGHPAFGGRARAGLTLIEVLVVLVIIGILATLTVAVASRVSGAGKGHMTRDGLRILDQVLTSYVAEKQAIPSPVLRDPREPTRQMWIPVVDGRNMSAPTDDQTIINSVGFFMYQAETEAGLGGTLKAIDSRMLALYDADSTDPDFINGGNVDSRNQFAPPGPGGPSSVPDLKNQPRIPTILDGWGQPIRYVHPTFGGLLTGSRLDPVVPTEWRGPPEPPRPRAVEVSMNDFSELLPGSGSQWSFNQIRRSDVRTGPTDTEGADADGGRPPSGRPYFYSAGPDGDPATHDDNIYITQPIFRDKRN